MKHLKYFNDKLDIVKDICIELQHEGYTIKIIIMSDNEKYIMGLGKSTHIKVNIEREGNDFKFNNVLRDVIDRILNYLKGDYYMFVLPPFYEADERAWVNIPDYNIKWKFTELLLIFETI